MSGKLGSLLAIVTMAICACSPTGPLRASAPVSRSPMPVRAAAVFVENSLPGHAGVLMQPHGIGISAYAVPTSVDIEGIVSFAVSTVSPTYSIDIYRVGWYGGAQGRSVWSVQNLEGHNQGVWLPKTFGVTDCPTCRYDDRTGLFEPHWATTYSLHIPLSWISGNYLARFTTPAGDISFAWFVVRNDHRYSEILAIMPLNTYQAYNNWGGKSLYPSNSFGPATMQIGQFAGAATQVSLERPYANWSPGDIRHDFQTVAFLERYGYDVTYATSVDLDRDPGLLQNHAILISVGHDEYWSRTMRDGVESARDKGISLIFFGGNDVFWQVRYGGSAENSERTVLICYRSASLDPVAKSHPYDATVHFSDPPLNRPSTTLTGTIYTDSLLQQPAPWVVAPTAPAWLLAGTSLAPGDAIAGLVGVECDRFDPTYPSPSTLVIVSDSPVVKVGGAQTHCNAVYYQVPSGAQVFSAGTWSWEDFIIGRAANPDVVMMTNNIITHFGASRRAP